MSFVSDELWAEIVATSAPEPDFRIALEYLTENMRKKYSEISDPNNYHSVKDELEDVLSAAERLSELIYGMNVLTEESIFISKDPDSIIKESVWLNESDRDTNFFSYYHTTIKNVALPMLVGLLRNAKNNIKDRKGGMTARKRKNLRYDAIRSIEKYHYIYSNKFIKRGKRGSANWLNKVIKLFDPHASYQSTEKLLQTWITERNSHPSGGSKHYEKFYKSYEKILRKSIIDYNDMKKSE